MKTIFSNIPIVLIMILASTNRILSCPSKCSCPTMNNTVFVNCSREGLTLVPTGFPNDTSSIDLKHNSITILQKGAFEDLPMLQSLQLDSNQITTIETGAFENLTALKDLNLANNQITTLQQGTVKDLTALENVDLSRNQITTVQQGTFKDLPALTSLRLDSNQITTIETGAFENLKALKDLNLANNRITTQQGTFKDLTALENLNLIGNYLTFVKDDTFAFNTNLSTLQLMGNQITTIEMGAFENLTALKVLSFTINQLTTVQGTFKNLPALTFLSLALNQLTTVQGTFKDLPALTSLTLSYNQLTTVQQGTFKDLPALTSLDLSQNQITTIQQGTFKDLPGLYVLMLRGDSITTIQKGAFENLTTLTDLDLHEQGITTIEKGAFKHLPALTSLNMAINQITTWEQGTFEDLPALYRIHLEDNKITTIQHGMFKDLTALDNLSLGRNNINLIQNGAFENLTWLTILDLASNQITTIQQDTFKDLTSLENLSLGKNNITLIQNGAFENLISLKILNLTSNQITTIQQDTFKDLTALENLSLGRNTITLIQKGAFENLTSLKILDLTSNQITTIQQDTFKDLTALENLSLGRNNITLIQNGAFENLTSLKILGLASNQITTIQQSTFQEIASLTSLDLRGNKLRFVRSDTFAHNTNLSSLYLDLYCDCNIPFWSWLKSKSFTSVNVTCLERNVQLSSLNASDFDNCTYNACQYTDYCSNGGSCSQDNSGNLTCSCIVDWTGATCTESANPCVENMDKFHGNWSKTAESTLATLACTGNYTGNASRYCSSDGKWQEPNYSNCIRKSIEQIKEQTDQLLSGQNETVSVTSILNELEELTRDNNELRSGDLQTSSAVLNDIAKYVTIHTDELSDVQLEIFGNLSDNLLDERNHQSWEELINERSGGVTSLVKAVTEFNDAFNDVIDGESMLVVVKENVVMEVGKTSSKELTVPNRLTTSNSWISDSATEIKLQTNICGGLTGYSSTFYRNISHLFPKYLIQNGFIRPFNGSFGVNSIIAEFTIHGTTCSDYALIIKFDHLLGNYSKPLCGHWNFSAPNTVNGAWSTFGSRVVDAAETNTICEYNHTTNFAILMSPGKTPLPHLFPLSLISAIGCGVSILFLVITIIIHVVFWRDVKNAQTTTLMNLCVALILSYVIFLAAITQTENKVVCSAIAVAMHYLFLTDFALMLAEGIIFVQKIVFLFKNGSILNKLIPACWIVPAGIVTISAGVTKLKGYGNHQFCWLSLETNLIWAFIGPALLVISINIIVIFIAVYKLMTIQAHATKTPKEKSKIGLKGIRVMLPLFGVMWIVGTFSLNEDLVMFQYLFAIFNSLQGLFIFLFNCCLTDKVRKGYREYQRRRANRMDLKLSTECTNNDKLKTEDERQNQCTEETDKTL